MEGKISESGVLLIKRKNSYKPQCCPFTKGPFSGCCSDECALFGEPKIEHTYKDCIYETKDTQTVSLCLCNKTLIFKKFSDERS